MNLESSLSAAVGFIETSTFPAHIDRQRAIDIIWAIKGSLTEFGTTPEEDALLTQIGVLPAQKRQHVHPALVGLLIHYHVETVAPIPSPTHTQGTALLLRKGLIVADPVSGSGYHTTDKGRELIRIMEQQF
jgi:hypothetical protein